MHHCIIQKSNFHHTKKCIIQIFVLQKLRISKINLLCFSYNKKKKPFKYFFSLLNFYSRSQHCRIITRLCKKYSNKLQNSWSIDNLVCSRNFPNTSQKLLKQYQQQLKATIDHKWCHKSFIKFQIWWSNLFYQRFSQKWPCKKQCIAQKSLLTLRICQTWVKIKRRHWNQQFKCYTSLR
jgi:hypothetical protein